MARGTVYNRVYNEEDWKLEKSNDEFIINMI